jgi:hypothetical protein
VQEGNTLELFDTTVAVAVAVAVAVSLLAGFGNAGKETTSLPRLSIPVGVGNDDDIICSNAAAPSALSNNHHTQHNSANGRCAAVTRSCLCAPWCSLYKGIAIAPARTISRLRWWHRCIPCRAMGETRMCCSSRPALPTHGLPATVPHPCYIHITTNHKAKLQRDSGVRRTATANSR